MYKIPISDLKEKITASGKLSSADLDEKIKAKINELSGLISEEGAAHIIANELGISLVPPTSELKIKEIYAGMRNVSTIGKVTRKYDVREFAKGETTGKVCSVLLGDETASIRVVFWNEQVDQLSDVKENDIIAVKDAYAKENQNGREIHLGGRASIEINPAGITIDSVREGTSYQRKTIKELEANQTGSEIMATVVQVFDPRFFQVHPETGKRIQPGEDVTPALSYVLNMVVDDGTGTVRCVLWKNQTNHLLDKSAEELAQYNEQPNQFEDVKTDLLGEQFKLMGKVQKNDMFDRLEFVVQMVEKAKPEEELKKLQKES